MSDIRVNARENDRQTVDHRICIRCRGETVLDFVLRYAW